MEEKYIIYFVAPIFLIVLAKLKMKRWWRMVNLVTFTIYFSIAIYDIFTNRAHDGGFVVSLLTTFLILIHLAVLVIIYFIAKKIKENRNS